MTVESATKISQLNPLGPPGSDPKSEGDNHLRLIKSCLQAVFDDTDGTAPIRAQMLIKALGIAITAVPSLDTDVALFGGSVKGNVHGTREFSFTTSGTWTKPADLKFLDVLLVGGGGGSSTASATIATTSTATGGGGAGAVIQARYKATDLPATVAYTVGAAGAAGTTATAGGSSTFKLLTAGGGAGSPTCFTHTATFNVSSPLASGGVASSTETGIRQILSNGGNGGCGFVNFGAANLVWRGQAGINILLPLVTTAPFGSQGAGIAGVFPGGGASGAANGVSQAAVVGAAGAGGILMLTEWY